MGRHVIISIIFVLLIVSFFGGILFYSQYKNILEAELILKLNPQFKSDFDNLSDDGYFSWEDLNVIKYLVIRGGE